MIRMTPRQRDLFGWPPVGSDYWTPQTLRDVAGRYPGMDMTPYEEGVAVARRPRAMNARGFPDARSGLRACARAPGSTTRPIPT